MFTGKPSKYVHHLSAGLDYIELFLFILFLAYLISACEHADDKCGTSQQYFQI